MMRILKQASHFVICAVIIITLVIALWSLSRICLFDYFTIPSESMSPTLVPGDKVVVNKMLMGGRIYKDLHFDKEGQELLSWRLKGLRSVQHNDICVFNFPKHKNRISFVINHVFCKRCVALPGDSLWVENGFYKNNNHPGVLGLQTEQETLAAKPDSVIPKNKLIDKYFGWNLKEFGPIYIPRKNERIKLDAHSAIVYRHLLTWETGKTIKWNLKKDEAYADGEPFKEHIWQHNYYFMAGDNVCASNDSRYWGLVPEEYIVGIVSLIIRDGQWLSIADD